MLLYPQARQSIRKKYIKLREKKRHKAQAEIAKNHKAKDSTGTTTTLNSSERSELERQNAFELRTDSESEDEDSICGEFRDSADEEYADCQSDAFEYVKMYKERRNSIYNSTDTFVDYGTQGKARKSSSINLIRLSGTAEQQPTTWQKQSLVIGSKAVPALARNSTERSSMIHTSTAQLQLGAEPKAKPVECMKLSVLPQPISENSQDSSVYDGRGLDGKYLACENLADLAAEAKIKKHLPESPTERHSMPNIFVGNRFNRSPNTAVYLPSWKDRNDMQNQSVEVAKSKEEADEVHSSTLDLPAACLQAPDKLQAELLYNFDASLDNVISPPSMYKEDVAQTSTAAAETKREDSIPRCISFQYIHMQENAQIPAANQSHETRGAGANHNQGQQQRQRRQHEDNDQHFKCRCCESSQCPSPRSSDSGMAGSCTIASPDPPNPETAYYYGGIGGLQFDTEQIDPARFDVCGNFREKFLTPEGTLKTEHGSALQVQTKSVARKPNSTEKEPNMLFSSTSNASTDASNAEGNMFRSGMYAHWWKKEKLPDSVLRGITTALKHSKSKPTSTQTSKDSRCSICSSCHCSFSLTGFSEGANYCALCQDCATSVQLAASNNTNTTNTSSFSCPLCSVEDTQMSESLTPAIVSSSSTDSSLECPICTRFNNLPERRVAGKRESILSRRL